MYKIILFILLFASIGKGQLINETFSKFLPNAVDSTRAILALDSLYRNVVSGDSMQADISAARNDFRIKDGSGGAAGAAAFYAAVTGADSSGIYDGGNSTVWDGAESALTIANASAGDFNPLTKDFSIEYWIALNSSVNDYLIGFGGGNSANGSFYIQPRSGPLFRFFIKDESANDDNADLDYVLADGVMSHITYTWDYSETEVKYYLNGVLIDSASASTIADSINPVAQAVNNFNIGQRNDGAANFGGWMNAFAFHTQKLTDKEIRESWALADGWYAKAGKVTRGASGNFKAFHQGFYDSDTVYFPVADLSGNYTLLVDAKGGKGGDVLTAWLGNGTAVTQTLTTSNVTYSLSLKGNTSATDSLWFSASASDTVYIDNVVMNSVGYENRFPRFPDFPKFPRR